MSLIVEINNMYPSTNGALFSGYRLCSAIVSLIAELHFYPDLGLTNTVLCLTR